jgi:hypothetical protein
MYVIIVKFIRKSETQQRKRTFQLIVNWNRMYAKSLMFEQLVIQELSIIQYKRKSSNA